MNGNIFNSKGTHVAVVQGTDIFGVDGQKLYRLRGINIYRLSGELVGHLNDAHDSQNRLDRSADRLFPIKRSQDFRHIETANKGEPERLK